MSCRCVHLSLAAFVDVYIVTCFILVEDRYTLNSTNIGAILLDVSMHENPSNRERIDAAIEMIVNDCRKLPRKVE